MAYSLALMKEPLTAARLREVLSEMEAAIAKGCICWAFSNHDVARAVSRWANGATSENLPLALMALLLTLPGTACLYQGEELGLTEAEVAHADMRDPYGLKFYPIFLGRDGSRTPMPWAQGDELAGFTAASRPWLPLPSEHLVRSVDAQLRDDASLLCAHRRFLRWRKTQPALIDGGFRLYDLPDPLFAFERAGAKQRILVVFNLENSPSRLHRRQLPPCRPIAIADFPFETAGEEIILPPYGVLFAAMDT
jgi:alpha-glucosidase